MHADEVLSSSLYQALATFNELEQCIYQNKQMGLAHQQEDSMQCDCVFDPGTSLQNSAFSAHKFRLLASCRN